MKYCPKCGCELEDDVRYCSECGADLTEGMPVQNENVKPNKIKRTYFWFVGFAFLGGFFIPLVGYALAGAGIGLAIKSIKQKDKLAVVGIIIGVLAIAFSVWSGIVGSQMIANAGKAIVF